MRLFLSERKVCSCQNALFSPQQFFFVAMGSFGPESWGHLRPSIPESKSDLKAGCSGPGITAARRWYRSAPGGNRSVPPSWQLAVLLIYIFGLNLNLEV
jgi:hypothetical protein